MTKLLTVDEVAKRLSLSEIHTRRLISSGKIPHVRLGRRAIRVSETDLNDFVRKRRSA